MPAETPPIMPMEPDLPRGWRALPREEVHASQRRRLMLAMGALAGSRGYANVTVGDVAKAAGVSKKSFYELFGTKEDCFAAALRQGTDWLLEEIERAAARHDDPVDALHAGLHAYLASLASRPTSSKAFLTETVHAGPAALAVRDEGHARFVALLREQHARFRRDRPELPAASDAHLVAIVGGINELIHRELRRGDGADVLGLESEIRSFVEAVLGLGPER